MCFDNCKPLYVYLVIYMKKLNVCIRNCLVTCWFSFDDTGFLWEVMTLSTSRIGPRYSQTPQWLGAHT